MPAPHPQAFCFNSLEWGLDPELFLKPHWWFQWAVVFANHCSKTGASQVIRGKESACQRRRCRGLWFNLEVGKSLWSGEWQPTPVFLPGKSHGLRSLANPMDRGAWWATAHGVAKEVDTTEHAPSKIIFFGDWELPLVPRSILRRTLGSQTLRDNLVPGSFEFTCSFDAPAKGQVRYTADSFIVFLILSCYFIEVN